MSLPEISRRCLSCGAAVRSGSRFCQQCGKPLAAEPSTAAASSSDEPDTREAEAAPPAGEWTEAAPESSPAGDWTPPTKEFTAFEQALESGPPRAEPIERPAEQTAPPVQTVGAAPAPFEAETPAAYEPPVAYESRPTFETEREAGVAADAGRAADAAYAVDADGASEAVETAAGGEVRGRVARVREGTRARVGRMREEAIVVLEETPDDSGLRFVVAAAALFVVFLVLLFLSTTVLR